MPQARRLAETIEQLSEDQARDVLRFIEERVAASKQWERVKALSDDPAFAISENRLGRFEHFRPRPLGESPFLSSPIGLRIKLPSPPRDGS
jgi:hypothetical protein